MNAKIHENQSSKGQIRNLMVVLLSAIASGCLLVAAMIHFWGPEGSYALRDVLLAPDVLPKLSYNEMGANTKNSELLIFDSIEFTYFDVSQHHWKTVEVPTSLYDRFYTLISADYSLEGPTDPIADRFDSNHASRLMIWVKPSNGSSADRRVFQEVSFSTTGNLYRVELHGQKGGEWIYYEHPAVHRAVMNLFIP